MLFAILSSRMSLCSNTKKKRVFLDRYKPDKHRTPICLFLRGHFTTLHPDEKFPTAWFNLGKDVNDADRFKRAWLGGGKQNGATSASASGSSWLRPVWTEGTTKRTKKDGDATKASSKATWLQPAFSHKTKPRKTTTEEKNQEEVETIADGLACIDQMIPRRINGKQKQQGGQQKQQGGRHYWTCPFCQTTINCISPGSLASSKRWHVESRHPNVKVELVQSRKFKKEEIIRPSNFCPKKNGVGLVPSLPPMKGYLLWLTWIVKAPSSFIVLKNPMRRPLPSITKASKVDPMREILKLRWPRLRPSERMLTRGMTFSSCLLKKVTVDPGNGLTAELVFLLSMVLRLGEFVKITSRC